MLCTPSKFLATKTGKILLHLKQIDYSSTAGSTINILTTYTNKMMFYSFKMTYFIHMLSYKYIMIIPYVPHKS